VKVYVEMMGNRYEKLESFIYLRAVMTNLNEIETEIKSKIAVGNKCYYALGSITQRRSIFQSIQIRLHKTTIRPTVTYFLMHIENYNLLRVISNCEVRKGLEAGTIHRWFTGDVLLG